jgi:L-alanine-DL-glutamate epimerase-like enolase superfamily enzyme
MRYVREHSGIAVTAGQADFYHDACRSMIEARAVDIINHDISGGSGMSDWFKIAKMADMYEIKMAHHEDPHLSMHMLAGIRLGLYPEYFSEERDPVTPKILVNQPKIKNGYMTVPDKPGFGCEFDEDFVKKYTV